MEPILREGRFGFHGAEARSAGSSHVAYVNRMAAELQGLRRSLHPLLHLAEGGSVLDVGFGTGVAAAELARIVGPGGRSAACDVSPAMCAEALRFARAAGVTVEVTIQDAHALAHQDNVFDAVRSERLFQHLIDPEVVLAEMLRVVRPGGRVVVIDADHGLPALDAADRRTTAAVFQTFASATVNPWSGRRLLGLFLGAGLADAEAHTLTLPWRTLEMADAAFNLRAALERAIETGAVTPEDAEAWWNDLRERDGHGRFVLFGLASPPRRRSPASEPRSRTREAGTRRRALSH